MNPYDFDKHLYETERMAISAMPYIPKASKYRHWSYKLLSGEITAEQFRKLRARLVKFHSQSV